MIRHLEPGLVTPTRAVVLGSSGFVGKDIVRHLRELQIAVLELSSADVDLTQPDAVETLRNAIQPSDSLVIVSAITPDKGKDAATLMRNLAMGERVSAFLEETPCAHVVYISSDAVYADDANPVRENSCCDPSSFHGLMHLVRERMFAAALQKTGTPYAILRPCAVYGANDTHNSYGPNRFLRTAINDGKISLFGQGEEKRDHVFIRDVSRLVGMCLNQRSSGTLNIATGHSLSFHDIAEQIASLCAGDVEIAGSPRANPVTHRHFDIGAIHQAFPEFKLTSIKDGLVVTLGELLAERVSGVDDGHP